jgi:mono/diheme cytochrome c family protein
MHRFLIAIAAAATGLPAAAQDIERGKLLYDTHCNECHYERVHERLRSDIKDLGQLRRVVARRALETRKRTFAPDELADIVGYLNASHYHFGTTAAKKP